MYLHVGQETVVKMSDIIGIFDMDNTTVSKHTRRFLAEAEKAGNTVTVSPELPKSFVVTAEKSGRKTVYISQLSTATLLRRNQQDGNSHER